jgi:translation initiation factor 2 subunit 2
MEYEELLKKARESMPAIVLERERFEIPKVKGHFEGNKTVISNFTQITQTLRRQTSHLLKYILKELATPGEVQTNGNLVLGSKVAAPRINEKIKQYAHEFVLCPDCAKPDTELKKEGNVTYICCTACGSKHVIKSRI